MMKDRFNRAITYLRLSVTDRCNLRCRYCMPEAGIACKLRHGDMLTEEEMVMAVQAAVSLGIKKIRITGGEPLVKKNILSICERIACVDGVEELCLTTNGTLLDQYALPLRRAGVQRLNISLDTLSDEKYRYMTRGGDIEQVRIGLKAAFDAGFEKIKLNAVLIGGFNDDEIMALADLTKIYPIDVRFIELMPMEGNKDFDAASFIRANRVSEVLEAAKRMPRDGGVAELYRLDGALGNIGVITALSNHFCGSCNRIRLTADGKLKPCLHSGVEYAIKGLDYLGMRDRMIETIQAKPACHDELSLQHISGANRTMNTIGG